MAKAKPETVSAAVVATHCNLTSRRVQQLAAEGIIPRVTRGRYVLVEANAAYCAYLQKLAQGQGDDGQRQAQTDLARARADRAQRENAVADGQLVSIEAIGSEVEAVFARVRARLIVVPGNVAAVVTGETDPNIVQDMITEEVARALDELNDDASRGAKGAAKRRATKRLKAA